MKKFIILSLISFALFFTSCDESNSLSTEPLSQNNESFGDNPSSLDKRGYAEFKVTLENLTPSTAPGASQPFSPPVLTTHTPRFHVFRLHKFASSELGQLAEDAVSASLVQTLHNSKFAYSIVEGTAGPIFPGDAQTFTIKTKLPFVRLSLASMLVNTNDAFTGVDGIRLPLRGIKEVYLEAYDAGTEMNTELEANIPGPCCGSPLVRVPTHERIKVHNGIKGTGDLDPSVYGWSGSVAKLTITRIK